MGKRLAMVHSPFSLSLGVFMLYFGIILLLSAFFVTAFWALTKKCPKKLNTVLKGAVLLFCAIGFFRFMLSDSFMFVINGGYYDEVFYEATDPLQTFLRWGYYLNYAVIPMAVFFESRVFRNIASYICLPFSLLSACFFNDYMVYFLSPQGRGLHLNPNFRYAYFILELAIAIALPILIQLCYRHVFRVKDRKEWLHFLLVLPAVVLLMIPVYVPQSLIGYSKMIASKGSDFHTMWIVILAIVTFALYFIFRFRPYRDRYMLCVFLTIVLFFHYDSLYLMGFSIPRLPIQLCNLAAYLYLIAIPFKCEKLFHFCFIANLTGTLLAIFLPDFVPGAFGFWTMHFTLEHSLVLMVPVLAMGLRIFPRITRPALKHSFIGFSIYFIFCLISGTILNGYADVTGFEVNYFFLFDLDEAFAVFPMFTFTERIHWQFGRFEIYPLFVLMIYVCFQLLCVCYYHAVRWIYRFEDDHLALRGSAIELYEKRTGKNSRRKKEFVD